MQKSKSTRRRSTSLNTAVATSILATALIGVAPITHANASTERCADVVKGGKNDCAVKALGTSCQGSASQDNLAGAWIKVPAGTCGNIVAICAGSADAPDDTSQKRLARSCKKIATQTDSSIVGGRLVDKYGESI